MKVDHPLVGLVPVILVVAFFASSASLADQPLIPTNADGESRAAATRGSKYWVYFCDKGASSSRQLAAAIAALEQSYSPRAVQRRQLRRTASGLFDVRDLPVNSDYMAAIEAQGAAIHVQSRWLNAVSAYLTPSELAAVRCLPFVARVEPVRGGRRCEPNDSDDVAGTFADGGVAGGFYGMMQGQLDMLWLPGLHQEGYTGQGVIIGVLDTGFLREHSAFNHPTHPLQIVAEHDFIFNDGNTANEENDDWFQHRHGTWILGVMG
ncbi:MAG: hypothetical protein JNG88_11505, partial [Phycisphaerales bacterium]|nr:hypothetical protein [Phycisphaerales bacterium]